GYVRTDDPTQADVLLVNTCAVRDHAEQRVLSRLGELKQYKRPGDVLGVVGCMAQRLGERLLGRVPQVDLVIGPDGYRGLPELIARARGGERAAAVEFKTWEHYEDVPPARETSVSAFVTVQRGCDYRCTFCIVPMTRGPERSRKLGDVVREVERLAAGGTTEVTLLGQTVNSYADDEHDFADLLRAVGAVPGVRRLRFTSPYPTDFTDRVLAALAGTPAACEHVHLPVQSCRSRLRPTSSSGSRARRRTTSRRLCPSWKRSASTTPTPSSTRRARGRRRSSSRTTWRTTWRASGSSDSSPWCGTGRSGRTSRSSARRTKSWSRAERSAARC